MSIAPAVLTAAPEQREVLRLALADAVYYQDPPQECAACPSEDQLCDECASRFKDALAVPRLRAREG